MDIIYFMKIKKNFMDIMKGEKKKAKCEKKSLENKYQGQIEGEMIHRSSIFYYISLFFVIDNSNNFVSTVGKLIWIRFHLWKISVPWIDTTTHECEYKLKVKVRDCCTRKRCIKKIRNKIQENIEFEKNNNKRTWLILNYRCIILMIAK